MSRIYKLSTETRVTSIGPSVWVLGLLWLPTVWMQFSASAAVVAGMTSWRTMLLGTLALVAVWQSVELARSWAAAARVLRTRQVPTCLWRQWMRQSLTLAGKAFYALGIGALGLMLPVNLANVWVTVGGMAVAGFCMLSYATLVWLKHRWQDAPPANLGLLEIFAFSKPVESLQAWIARYPTLVPIEKSNLIRNNTLSIGTLIAMPVYLTYLLCWSAAPISGAITLAKSLLFGVVVIFVIFLLACKNLHWRVFLAPGGPPLRRLGWHIALSTMTLFMPGFLVGGAIVLLAVGVFLEHPLVSLWGALPRFVGVPFELFFAVCIGTLIRGTRHPKRWMTGWIAALLGLLMVAGAWNFFHETAGVWWAMFKVPLVTVGWQYILWLLALSALALWASNKLWTVQRLMQSAP